MPESRPVIVCTERRYVAFGYATDTDGSTIKLERARCAIYWGTTGGLHELAATGPTPKSRIGSVAPAITLHGVTTVLEVSADAAAKWESA